MRPTSTSDIAEASATEASAARHSASERRQSSFKSSLSRSRELGRVVQRPDRVKLDTFARPPAGRRHSAEEVHSQRTAASGSVRSALQSVSPRSSKDVPGAPTCPGSFVDSGLTRRAYLTFYSTLYRPYLCYRPHCSCAIQRQVPRRAPCAQSPKHPSGVKDLRVCARSATAAVCLQRNDRRSAAASTVSGLDQGRQESA